MLRKCEVKLYPGDKVEKAYFHGWFQDYEQLGSGDVVTCVIGIVELDDGKIIMSAPDRIKFDVTTTFVWNCNDRIVSEVRGNVSVSS